MRRKELLLLAAVLLLGGFLRIFHLGTMFFNGDEPMHQIRISYQPLAYVFRNNNGPLFSILVHFLLPLGSLEIMARLVPFLTGVLAIVATFFLGRALFSKAVGLTAAFLAACSHLLIFYSQNSRTYAPLTFLFLLSFYYLYKAVRDGDARSWGFYGLTLCLCLYNHTIAFLILPSYAVYVGYVWLDSKIRSKAGGREPLRPRTVRRFIAWTVAAVGLAALFYLPCAWMLDMFLGSFRRGLSRPQDYVALTLQEIGNILKVEISPKITGIFVLTLILFAVGLLTRLKAKRRESLLVAATVGFPWLVFYLGKPRANDVFSLYRYLQFLLPLIFIMAARGIDFISSGAAALAARAKGRGRSVVRTLVQITLAVVLAAGYVMNLSGYYYSDYWRQGSYRFDREVKAIFEERADRDALLYIDAYPVSSLLLMMNPLAKDQRAEETEIAARENYVRPPGARQVMVLVQDWTYFLNFVASRKIEMWALTPRTPEKTESLRAASANDGRLEVFDLVKFTLLHFKKDDRSVAEKMAALADILASWPDGDSILRRQRRLFAAKAYVMTRDVRDAIREVKTFEDISVNTSAEAANGGSGTERILGDLLGFNAAKLREIYERRGLAEVQTLFLMLGNNLVDAGLLPDAALAYEEVVHLGHDLDDQVLERLVSLGDRLEQSGKPDQALKVWDTASRLDPKRQDISSRISRIRAKAAISR
jgi:tetratricopeptide (TPR) repeat protein